MPLLVRKMGGDALSISFNTIAILFLCDIDNISFKLALPERIRARVETVGRINLSDTEASTLVTMKIVHVCLIMLAMLTAVWADDDPKPFPFLGAFLLGSIVQTCTTPKLDQLVKVKRVAMSIGGTVCGFVGWVMLLVFAQTGNAREGGASRLGTQG